MLRQRPDERHGRHDQIASAFRLLGSETSKGAAPLVIVKRRRALALAEHAEEEIETLVRAPKVHRVERLEPVHAGAQGEAETPATTVEQSESLPSVPGKRPRRRLHGKVQVVTLNPPPRDTAPARTGPRESRDASARNPFIGPADPRYEALLARIADLEAKAAKRLQEERADIIRWARRAIHDFDITIEDLGLKPAR